MNSVLFQCHEIDIDDGNKVIYKPIDCEFSGYRLLTTQQRPPSLQIVLKFISNNVTVDEEFNNIVTVNLTRQSTYLVLCDQTGNNMISRIIFALDDKQEFQWPTIK
jgi:hypothetical protein